MSDKTTLAGPPSRTAPFGSDVQGQDDLISADPHSRRWLVCGYFTPDYRHWAETLADSLRRHNAPYHLFATTKAGTWEATSRQKPAAILNAMGRYPDKAIVWLDVDCQVLGDLSPLADLRADVAAYTRTRQPKWRRRQRFLVKSGTMVFKPTEAARAFVGEWSRNAARGQPWDSDQHSLLKTFGEMCDVTFQRLPHTWCTVVGERHAGGSPIIEHASAAREHTKPWKLIAKVLMK
jgi:hypothetical protein